MLYTGLKAVGMLLILACIFGRLWSTLYIGTRKNSEVVMTGPYSITRNPLYLFSTIGAFGAGLVFGSIVVAFGLGLVSYIVFSITANGEASYLRSQFGPEYLTYEAGTPQFWPNFSLYTTASEVMFSPPVLQRAFGDSLYFLAVIPLVGAVEYLQSSGYLPVIFWLP
ncbi:isoprenylcysteine carboxylmethyltransferase family protein [Hoeflea sp. AS60]|uniref:methyltransferase family protein n=1 Tax=Hoeflea sp. AS60 TaxID=3135780 RepID=UPI00316B4B3A